jgi:hypothetical protein
MATHQTEEFVVRFRTDGAKDVEDAHGPQLKNARDQDRYFNRLSPCSRFWS